MSKLCLRPTRWLVPLAAGAVAVGLAAAPAVACGGLVGENGTIQLTRTTTLAAYHDGVERYVTSFEFSGTGQGGRFDRAAARRAARRSSGAATGRCNGSNARSRRRSRSAAVASTAAQAALGAPPK